MLITSAIILLYLKLFSYKNIHILLCFLQIAWILTIYLDKNIICLKIFLILFQLKYHWINIFNFYYKLIHLYYNIEY